MQPGIIVPDALDIVDVATRAEELGYGSVWLSELWGADALVELGALAERTDSVTLGTAIVNVFSRSPAALAMAAATVDDCSGGRMTLGVGVSTEKAIEDLHGVPFDRPVRRAHETIDLVKRFTAGEDRVEYDGELFEVADFPPLGADVPVYHAALGKANRRVVARLADGWLPHMIPFPDLDEAFDYVAEHAREADRDPGDITVAPYVPAAVSDDPAQARDAVRGHIAYYVGSGEGYRAAVGAHFDEADAVAEAWRAGERGAAADRVTDEMVDALGVAGTPDRARERLADLQDGVVDLPIVVVPQQAATDLGMDTIEALAPK
jgi:alkanesulfonate monooxygenase SsuD/methylene tetrahydromethanopterin reductase-like flavin-dependent oxidoreductase (luciferase family)